MNLDRAVNIDDLRRLAMRRLPRVAFDFLDGGAEDEVTLRANRTAFERIAFRPRILPGAPTRDLSVELFGDRFNVPFFIGPTGINGLYWPDADLALARAAGAIGAGAVASSPANNTLEEIAASTSAPKWFQLYPWGADRVLIARLVERAQAAGYKALVVTVDMVLNGKRERDIRHQFAHKVTMTPAIVLDGLLHPIWLFSTWLRHGMPMLANIVEFAPKGANANEVASYVREKRFTSLTWDDIAWIASIWKGPMLVKGILTAEDALNAKEIGAAGIVVSNHGGRQLDGAPATIDVLPEIVEAVGDQMTIAIDGGFRRGSDIVKALAIGADVVFLGRATLYGVAAGGEPGVARALEILRDETDRVLTLVGCKSVSELTSRHVQRLT
jgi:(S)-mandelate dehydrogenase